MLLPFKQKRKSKERSHTVDGKYDKKAHKDSQQLIDKNEDWDNDDDSKWDDLENMEAEFRIHQRLKEFDLVWRNNNQLEKIKQESYKIDKIPKSTYYNKYGSNSSLTKAAAGTKK